MESIHASEPFIKERVTEIDQWNGNKKKLEKGFLLFLGLEMIIYIVAQ